jgi:NAD dependent epimerase/dehydratase family enzyme
MFGEMAESLLLSGQNVIPDKLLKDGYHFKYIFLKDALENLLSSEIKRK